MQKEFKKSHFTLKNYTGIRMFQYFCTKLRVLRMSVCESMMVSFCMVCSIQSLEKSEFLMIRQPVACVHKTTVSTCTASDCCKAEKRGSRFFGCRFTHTPRLELDCWGLLCRQCDRNTRSHLSGAIPSFDQLVSMSAAFFLLLLLH